MKTYERDWKIPRMSSGHGVKDVLTENHDTKLMKTGKQDSIFGIFLSRISVFKEGEKQMYWPIESYWLINLWIILLF